MGYKSTYLRLRFGIYIQLINNVIIKFRRLVLTDIGYDLIIWVNIKINSSNNVLTN